MSQSWEQNIPHRRFNLLTRNWILCSPHRAKRPWLGQVEKPIIDQLPQYDPSCFLCPGNKRAATNPGEIPPSNPQYTSTFVFTNDFSALLDSQSVQNAKNEVQNANDDSLSNLEKKLCHNQEVTGLCKVICFSPRHDLTLAEMELKDVVDVVTCWKEEYQTLSNQPNIEYVQIFENRGAMMGCSNPHPHCQIWSGSFIPQEPQTELDAMSHYYKENKSCLLCDYLEMEQQKKIRIVCENEGFLVVVPYWALWPFEVLVLSKKHLRSFKDFSEKDSTELADIIKRMTCKYDNLFQTSFPYSMGIHQAPAKAEFKTEEENHSSHFHMHFYPPLLRSATVKKFMVGYEMLGEAQRDITAEQSAERLRALSDTVHYKAALKQST